MSAHDALIGCAEETERDHLELNLRAALSAVADRYGKIEALRIAQEWARTKIEEVAA